MKPPCERDCPRRTAECHAKCAPYLAYEEAKQEEYSEQDAEIVRRYVIDKTPQIDVAVELDMARSTITRRLPQIYARARHTAAKLQMISE